VRENVNDVLQHSRVTGGEEGWGGVGWGEGETFN